MKKERNFRLFSYEANLILTTIVAPTALIVSVIGILVLLFSAIAK